MRPTFRAVLLVISLIFGSAAHAATVKTIEGNVLINRGNGYESVGGTAQAQVGDSIMVRTDGVAQIIYADGCAVIVQAGSVVSVGPPSSCKTRATFAETRMGVGAGDRKWSPHVQPDEEGFSTHHILLGTAVAGGIGVGIYYLTKRSGDDKPASP